MGNYLKPTLLEKLDLLPALCGVLFTIFVALLNGVRRGPNDEPSLYLHVVYAATRRVATRLSASQSQWVFQHTDVGYQQEAKASKIPPRIVDLPHGARGNWIGDPNAEHVLVWYHGGGFTLPPLGHLRFFMRLIKSRRDTKPSLSIFFLEYTLAPTAKYPTQLTQAVEALRHLITTAKRSPSQIIIGGDSAGGNLVCGVLSHLAHRHEAIEELTLGEPLSAAVMMAPWTALNNPDAGLAGYEGGDVLTKRSLEKWVGNYMGDATPDYYTDASRAPAQWFRGLPVKKILVMAGQHEYLLPEINTFVKTLEAGYGPLEFHVAAKEAHIAPFVNLVYRYNLPTGQGEKLVAWIEEVIA